MSNRVGADDQNDVVVHSTTDKNPAGYNAVSVIVSQTPLPVTDLKTRVSTPINPSGKQYQPTDFVVGQIVPIGLPVVVTNLDSFDHFKQYIQSKCCYNSAPLDQAIVVVKKNRNAFQVDMWTLMEHRSIEWKTRPYRGESVPGIHIDNVFNWKDFPFDTPSTAIPKKRTRSHTLTDTQHKIMCSSCNGQGKQHCSSCNGTGNVARAQGTLRCSHCHGKGNVNCDKCATSGYLLSWAIMTMTWHTLHSIGIYQNTFLPEKIIRKIPGKPTFYENDMEWTNDIFLLNYGNLYRIITEKSSLDFGQGIQQQYQNCHFAKLTNSMLIRKLKCLIRKVDIIETNYKLDGYVNKSERNRGK